MEQFAQTNRSKYRRSRAVESFRSAAETIGPIEKDMAVFAVTRGQFSMIDCVVHGLAQMGRSSLTLWTWCIADYEIDAVKGLMASGEIESALLVIDHSGEQQRNKDKAGGISQGELLTDWVATFGAGSIRVCRNHAKIATLSNGAMKVVMRGSMNLNANPRFEQLDVSEGSAVFDLVHGIEQELPVLGPDYTNRQVLEATGLSGDLKLLGIKTLQLSGIRTWRK